MNIAEKIYGRYQLEWMINNNKTLKDFLNKNCHGMEELNEFLTNEYQNPFYIKGLCYSEDDFKSYLRDRKLEEGRQSIAIVDKSEINAYVASSMKEGDVFFVNGKKHIVGSRDMCEKYDFLGEFEGLIIFDQNGESFMDNKIEKIVSVRPVFKDLA